MGPQILIPATQNVVLSGFIKINQNQLPATIQADGLTGSEEIDVNSVAGFAQGKLTLTGQPLNTETVTIGGRTYTFLTALTNTVPDEILIGGSPESSLDNLQAAINLAGGIGNDFSTGTTINLDVSAEIEDDATANLYVIAKAFGSAGGLIATSDTLTNGSWGATSLVNSTEAVFEGGSPILLSLTNNRIAINSPVEIQASKPFTAVPVAVTIAYRDQV